MANSFCRGTARFLIAFLLATGAAAALSQSRPLATTLAVPASALPSGCALQPPAPSVAPTSFGMSAVDIMRWSLFPTNPWSGSERKTVAEVRKAIDSTPRVVPDGPPPDARSAAAFELRWADNILEAYRAVYSSNGSEVQVLAVMFNDEKLVTPEPLSETVGRRPGATSRIVRGATVIRVSAPTPTECFRAIRAYMESLK